MPTTDEIRTKLISILADHDLLDRQGKLIAPDSMAMVLISMQIENLWAPFPQECLEVQNFASIDSIVAMIETLIRRASAS
ncbi:MAG TPA: hypothetical protein VGM39_14250 [Kofleriaceae bacterium]|jgi:hypothetical protein